MRRGPLKPDVQTRQGRADGRRQQPHGGGHRLHGYRHQQRPDTVEGRPERNDHSLVISGLRNLPSVIRRTRTDTAFETEPADGWIDLYGEK